MGIFLLLNYLSGHLSVSILCPQDMYHNLIC